MKENIRNEAMGELSDILTNFVSHKKKHDELKFYVGRIENNNDPDKNGRCKIRVYGIYSDDIPENDLPWANPDFNFIGSTLGSFVVPPNGTIVRVYFEQDDFYRPMYTTKVVDRSNFSSEKDEDYPNSMILFESDIGDFFKINRSTGESVYRHASGLIINIDKSGNMSIDNTSTSTGNLEFTIKGNVSITSQTGSITLDAPTGNVKLGGDCATQTINNLPNCLFTGAPHSIGQQLPGIPGSATVKQ